jgi:hypothetical protein
MISATALIQLVIWLLIAGAVWWLLNWLVDYIGVPEPFRKVIKIILAIIAVLIVINALLMLVGTPLFRF